MTVTGQAGSLSFYDAQWDPKAGLKYSGSWTIQIYAEDASCSAADAVAKIVKLDGDANVLPPGQDWQEAKQGAALCNDDEIHTGPDSSVDLQFKDGGVAHVSEMTRIKIRGLANRETRFNVLVLLKMGEISSKIEPQRVIGSGFTVKSPTATASVRGTVFTVAYDPGTRLTTVATARGKVEVDPTGRGATIMVSAGQAVDVTSVGAKTVSAATIAARERARRLVLAKIAAALTRCAITIPRAANTASVRATGASFVVTVKTSKGTSTWTVAGARVTPTNALAKKIAAGCK